MSTSCSQETTCLGRVWGLFNPLSWCKILPGKGTCQIPKGASPRTYMKQVGLSSTELDSQGCCTGPSESPDSGLNDISPSR